MENYSFDFFLSFLVVMIYVIIVFSIALSKYCCSMTTSSNLHEQDEQCHRKDDSCSQLDNGPETTTPAISNITGADGSPFGYDPKECEELELDEANCRALLTPFLFGARGNGVISWSFLQYLGLNPLICDRPQTLLYSLTDFSHMCEDDCHNLKVGEKE